MIAGGGFYRALLLMIATTALWALAFIVPVMMPQASALDITFGRYFAYGICSLALLWRFGKIRFTWRDWCLAAAFALFGNLLYYALLVLGVQLAGPALAVIIIGLLPVSVALWGNHGGGNAGAREAPFRKLALPLALVLAGLLLVNVSRSDGRVEAGPLLIIGILCLVAPVVMWTWYAVANARFLKRRAEIGAGEWASAIGVATLALTTLAFPLHLVIGSGWQSIGHLFATGDWLWLAFWSTVLGLGASWGAAMLFNAAAKNLPVTLTGQLIVFETIFGAFYVFLAEGSPPRLMELAGFALSVLGIWISIRALQRHQRAMLPIAG